MCASTTVSVVGSRELQDLDVCSFKTIGKKLTQLTTSALYALQQLDDQLAAEREQISAERARIAILREQRQLQRRSLQQHVGCDIVAVGSACNTGSATTVAVGNRSGDDMAGCSGVPGRDTSRRGSSGRSSIVAIARSVDLPSYNPKAPTVRWVSAPPREGETRCFPSDTIFRRPDGQWLQARQFVPTGGDVLIGLKGETVMVRSVTSVGPREDFMRLRTATGSIVLHAEHELLVEGTGSRFQAVKAGHIRSWKGPLPRIYDGTFLHQIDCAELFQESREALEVAFDSSYEILAWTECPLGNVTELDPPQNICPEVESANDNDNIFSPVSASVPAEVAAETTTPWVSAPSQGQHTRFFTVETAFQHVDGRWVRAAHLRRDGGEKLRGHHGSVVEVHKAVTFGPRTDLVRLRTSRGNILLVAGHSLIIEGGALRPESANTNELRNWQEPLPRIFNGQQHCTIDCVEGFAEPHYVVAVHVAEESALLAWTQCPLTSLSCVSKHRDMASHPSMASARLRIGHDGCDVQAATSSSAVNGASRNEVQEDEKGILVRESKGAAHR